MIYTLDERHLETADDEWYVAPGAHVIGDGSLIANGARVLDGARIGERCIVAAGSLVPPRKTIPDGSLAMGAPAQIVRRVTPEDIAMIEHACAHYRERARMYRTSLAQDPRACS